jgi:RND family efflux transporter MFP subunit
MLWDMLSKFASLLKNKRLATIIVIITVIIGFIFWKQRTSTNSAVQYQTAIVERGALVTSVSASGQIITTNIVSVATQATGTIKEVFVKDGDQVVAGQKVMEINLDGAGQAKNAAAYTSYLSAQNSLNSAQAKINSLQSALFKANQTFMNDKGVPNPSDTDKQDPKYIEEKADWLQAEADYKNQQNVIAQSQSSLNSSWLSYRQTANVVTSPVSGTITNITYVPGMVISPTSGSSSTSQNVQQVAVIKNNSTPNASVNVSEIDVYKLKTGQPVTLTLDSVADKTFTGKVISVDRIGSVTSNVTNYPVIVQFDTDNPQILPNMAVTANIIVSTKTDVLIVPSSAVQTQNGVNSVRVMKNNTPQSVTVEVGDSSGTETEIRSGLNEGDEVITGTISSQTSTTTGTRSVFGGTGFGGGFGGGGNRGGGTAVIRRGG